MVDFPSLSFTFLGVQLTNYSTWQNLLTHSPGEMVWHDMYNDNYSCDHALHRNLRYVTGTVLNQSINSERVLWNAESIRLSVRSRSIQWGNRWPLLIKIILLYSTKWVWRTILNDETFEIGLKVWQYLKTCEIQVLVKREDIFQGRGEGSGRNWHSLLDTIYNTAWTN